ncbi:MAG: hypothetical protein V7K89_26375 [Nostoc sp.]
MNKVVWVSLCCDQGLSSSVGTALEVRITGTFAIKRGGDRFCR